MPIEPTSVSKPAIREVEKSATSYPSWSSMQGSSTGGKDRPLNSIWEKAINGAQKLFGLETPKSTQLDETVDSDSLEERSEQTDTDSDLRLVPGFGNRGLTQFSGSVFGNSPFGAFTTSSRNASEGFSKGPDLDVSAKNDSAQPSVRDSRSDAAAEPKSKEVPHHDDVEDETDDEVASEAKTSKPAPAATSIRGAASTALPQNGVQPTTVQSEGQGQIPNAAQPQAATAAAAAAEQQIVAQTPQATVSQSQTAVDSQIKDATTQASQATVSTPQKSVKDLNTNAEAKIAGNTLNPKGPTGEPSLNASKQDSSATAQTATATPKVATETVAKPFAPKVALASEQTEPLKTQATVAEAGKQGLTETAKATPAPEATEGVASKAATAKSDLLEIDTAKAKSAVSEGLGRVESKQARPTPQAVPVVTNTNTTSESNLQASKPLTTEPSAVRLAEGQAKDLAEPVITGDKAKSEAPAASAVRTDRTTTGNSTSQVSASRVATDWVAQEPKLANVVSQTQTVSQTGANAREAANAVASRMQNTAVASKPANAQANANGQGTTSVSGLAASGGTAANTATQGARSGGQQQQGGESAAKQDLNANLTQSTAAKAGEKLGGETAHSFEAKMDTASGRRAEAAAKTRQTSYVSKTADEVKEVVATLTKSIDRLVSSKPGTMNLKLNFEGGGTMNIRITMDGNQVATTMQTDVSGLESAIKSHWSELSNDWNQKGVKLSVPNFQNADGTASKEGASDFNEFAQRGERQATEGRSGFEGGRGRGSRFAQSGTGATSTAGEGAEMETPGSAPQTETASNAELKTYA